jgi:hypothetical protein
MNQTWTRDTLGIQETPHKDHRPYIDHIVSASQWAHKHRGAPRPISDQVADLIIYISFCLTKTEQWQATFTRGQRTAAQYYRDPNTYWRVIQRSVTTPAVEKKCLQLFPSLRHSIYFPDTIDTPAPREITPRPTPNPRKTPAPRRQETISAFIADRAPSIVYLKGFVLISRHTKNRFSATGCKVYPYGQQYVADQLDVSLRTASNMFSWYERHHFIFKRTNENPREHKCATWFVCTSWKQSTYFLDPQHRRPKRGAPRSRRKRDPRPVRA